MKIQRQQAIVDIVRTKDIFTQGELTDALSEAGFVATQATISRDIRELRLTKEQTDNGQKYVAPNKQDEPLNRYLRLFNEGVVSVKYAGNMMVLQTISGMAMAVALALDNMDNPEILGSVAGDDVVISVIRSEQEAKALVEKLMA